MNSENKNDIKKYTDCPKCKSHNTVIISYMNFNLPLAICYGFAGMVVAMIINMILFKIYNHFETDWIRELLLLGLLSLFVFPACGFIYGSGKEKYINLICKDCGNKFRKLSK